MTHLSTNPVSKTVGWAAGALLALRPVSAVAQVNVEPIRGQIEESGFGARLRLSVSGYAGNTEGIVLGSAGLVGGRAERHLGFVSASGDYARFGGEVNVAKAFGHLRHNYELGRVVAWEEFAQIESDRFRRIRLRGLLGTGPRFALVQGERLASFYGTSYMLEHTQIAPSDTDGESSSTAHRWNNYLAVTLGAGERILLDSVSYFQPRFDDFGDYHLLSVNGAEFKVTERLNSRIDVTIRYESVTPAGVEGGDLEFKSSLELSF